MLNREAGESEVSVKVASADEQRWYALRVRSRHEKKVADELETLDVTVSLPLMRVTRQWSDRSKEVDVPLFKGYVFARINLKSDRFTVLQPTGVVQLVGLQGRPIAIPDEQMYWLDRMMSCEQVRAWPEYPRGSKVRVVHGPLLGLEGVVVERKNATRLVVWFDAIMQGLSIDIAVEVLKPVSVRQSVAELK